MKINMGANMGANVGALNRVLCTIAGLVLLYMAYAGNFASYAWAGYKQGLMMRFVQFVQLAKCAGATLLNFLAFPKGVVMVVVMIMPMTFANAFAQTSSSASQHKLPAIFNGADLKMGEKLIAEHKCVACHQAKVSGDGSAIYKPAGRISTAGFLRGMVEQCNTELNLGMFPEEVNSVAAVLNRDHYKFK